MAPLQLTVPATAAVENPNTITSPLELSEWVNDLPFANPKSSAESLLESLLLLNRHPKPLPQRYELLACYQQPLDTLLSGVRAASRQVNAISRNRRDAELATLVEQMNLQLAFGYKKAILENRLDEKTAIPPEVIAGTLYYALNALSNELMFAYTRYQQEPRNIWPEVIQIFLLAERLKVSTMEVVTGESSEMPPPFIRLAFKRMLLISILNPYRLQRSEAWATFDYLLEWAQHARLGQFKTRKNIAGCFLIPLQGPLKHIRYDCDDLPANAARMLLLDTTPLSEQVHMQMQSVQAGDHKSIRSIGKLGQAAAEHLLRTMLVSWHVNPTRRHERQEKYQWLVTACGIGSIHHFLRQADTPLVPDSGGDESEEIHEIHDVRGNRVELQAANYETYRWRQINLSASGVGLILPPEEIGELQVGQLVLLRGENSENATHWSVGVVRRMIQRDARTVETGIQFVQGNITAATIRPEVFGSEERADFQPALLLDRGKEYPGVLFTPHLLYHPNREYVIEDSEQNTIRANAGKRLESTSCFERFEYEVIKLHG